MHRGEIVWLKAFGNQQISRRVVAVGKGTLEVCRDEEYQAAQREGRQPTTVGFPKTAIISEGEKSG